MDKIFCIGANKTGTSSLTEALSILGFRPCPEYIMYNFGSPHFENFQSNKFGDLLGLINQYDVFEDRPWNHTNFYQVLDNAFKNSKFILTIRDTNKWWDSYLRWDKKINLRNSWHYKINSQTCYGVDSFLDHPNLAKKVYSDRNAQIINYFSNSPSFLILDIDEEDKFEKLCSFLNKDLPIQPYPNLNKT